MLYLPLPCAEGEKRRGVLVLLASHGDCHNPSPYPHATRVRRPHEVRLARRRLLLYRGCIEGWSIVSVLVIRWRIENVPG